jgi:hypothetical protein
MEGAVSTTDLLVLTISDQLLLALKKYFFAFTKQAILTRRSIVLSLPLQQGFPGLVQYLLAMPERCAHKLTCKY